MNARLIFVIVAAMKVDVNTLAELSKIKLSDQEEKLFADDFESILEFVSSVQELDLDMEPRVPVLHNVLSSDDEQFDYGYDKKKLVTQAPKNDSEYILVKKVIDR